MHVQGVQAAELTARYPSESSSGVARFSDSVRPPDDSQVAPRHPCPRPAGLHDAGDCIWARCLLRLRRSLFPGGPREPRGPAPGRDSPGHGGRSRRGRTRSEENTSELQSPCNLVCRLLLEKKKFRYKLLSLMVSVLYSDD